MSLAHLLVVGFFRGFTCLLSRIDDAELEKVPPKGPLILYCNHVNLLEIPILYTHLQPRRVHGMVYANRWENPLLGWMLDVTQSIPLHRGEADLNAIRQGLDVLERGEMLVIAPEGTRSHDGQLGMAHPGVVLLALHSRAPLLPVAYFGAEKWKEDLRHLRRTDFHLRVGKPFQLQAGSGKVTGEVRTRMLDEMMYRLAALLPAEYRGVYADTQQASTRYITFERWNVSK